MSDMVSIKGLSKAKVLAVLYNGARAQGLGFLQYDSSPMGEEEASQILLGQTDFDYLKGRVLKVDLSGDEFDPWLYDRDNGAGTAARIIGELQRTGDTNPEEAEITHLEGTRNAAILMEEHVDDKSYAEMHGDMLTVGLGTSEFADEIKPIIKRILDNEEDEDSPDTK